MDLPASWRAAVQFCPHCSGRGERDDAPCPACDGTGDLMRTLLERAYRRGRDDALLKMRETYRVSRLAGVQVAEAEVPDLKIGL